MTIETKRARVKEHPTNQVNKTMLCSYKLRLAQQQFVSVTSSLNKKYQEKTITIYQASANKLQIAAGIDKLQIAAGVDSLLPYKICHKTVKFSSFLLSTI